MPAVGGYGYNAILAIYGEGLAWSYITQNEGALSTVSLNYDAPVYNTPDRAGSTNFENGSYIVSKNDSSVKYKYTINKTASTYSVTLYDSDGTTAVDTATMVLSQDFVEYDEFCFAVLCNYTDEENPPIIKAGIGANYFGLSPDTLYPIEGSPCCFQWFTASRALEIITDCMVVTRVTTSGGNVVTRLKESDNFIITQLPNEIFEKGEIITDFPYSNVSLNDIIPLNDNEEMIKSVMSYHVPTYSGPIEYWPGTLYNSMFAVHTAFLDKYKEGVGSDLFRKTVDGKFTNVGDILQYQNMTIKYNGTADDAYNINFSGGSLKWRFEPDPLPYGSSHWYLDFCNANDVVVDTWHMEQSESPWWYGPQTGYYYTNVATAFLCKQGDNYYIVGLTKGLFCKDNDNNPLPTSYYNESAGYVVLKKLNTSANEVLNNGTETVVEYDETAVEDTSEVGSLPQDTGELYDERSIWDSGENAGTNDGIRHNGSEIIDGSNGELTEDHPVGQVPEYNESGENRIPTPLNTKMIVGFAPTTEEMETFSDLMKQTDFIDKMVGYFTNAVDGVVSCHTCIAPALDKGPDCYLKYGLWDTSLSGLTMKTLTQKMYHCNMGSINLLEKRNSYKDYPPFTNYKIYLPYIGVRDIDGRTMVGKQLTLWYHINVLTGDILAELRVSNQNSQITSSFCYWTGNTLEPFPLTSQDFSSQIQSGINAILSTGTAIASGASGNVIGAFAGGVSAVKNLSDAFRPDIRTVGTVAGNMAQQMYGTAYIIKEYPYLGEKNPYNYNRLAGLPSNIGNKVSFSATGSNSDPNFVSFRNLDLYGIKTTLKHFFATETEKEEIDSLLKTGVYV